MAKPEIRLKGFEGEWKNSSLMEICTINPSSTLPDSFEYVDLESVVGTEMISHRKEYKNTAPSRAQRLAKDGDIFYQTVRPYQKNNYLFRDRSENYVFSTGYAQLRTGLNSNYLFNILQSNSFVNQVLLSCTGTSYPAINPSNLSKLQVSYTDNKDEQQAIADYFGSLDSMIQATTKKIASLKQMKSASLISMFPQAGETKPRVRFKGFEGEWLSSKLGTFSKKVTTKNTQLAYKITLTNSAEYGIINQLDFFDHDISNGDNIRNYYVVGNDDFVYNPRISSSAPFGPINRNMLGYTGVMSPLYYVFKVDGIDKDYLTFFFKTCLWHKFMKDNGNSGARFDRLSINDDVFVQMPIIYPSDVKEQQRIASYFKSLDKQISLQEQRLEKLKQIKAACLDKMFV